MRPLPVTTRMRAASSWRTMRAIVRDREDPQQAVAVVGAQDRVGGDAGEVVVGQPGKQSGPRTATSASAPARRPRIPASARCGPRRTRCGRGSAPRRRRCRDVGPDAMDRRRYRAARASDTTTEVAVTDRSVTNWLGRPSSLKESTGWARGSSRPSSSRPWRPIVADLSSGDRPEKSTNGTSSRQHENTIPAFGSARRRADPVRHRPDALRQRSDARRRRSDER